jgi:hypothetical protein
MTEHAGSDPAGGTTPRLTSRRRIPWDSSPRQGRAEMSRAPGAAWLLIGSSTEGPSWGVLRWLRR